MTTNDFIKELEKLDSHFSEVNMDSNLWNGFSLDFDSIPQYERHLTSLYIDYSNEISDHIDYLLANKSVIEINLFINSKINRFESIKAPLIKWDDEYKIVIEDIREELERMKSLECDKNNVHYKKAIIRLEQKEEAFQLVHDFLICNIGVPQLKNGINKWENYEDIEADGWDERKIDQYYYQIRMERIGREHIEKSLTYLKELSNNYSFADNNQQVSLKNKKQIEEKGFISYLHHNDKDALMVKLHELLDGKKGKLVATLIIALEKLCFIGGYENRATLYNSMRNEFGDIGANAGLNDFITNDYKIPETELNKYMEILKGI